MPSLESTTLYLTLGYKAVGKLAVVLPAAAHTDKPVDEAKRQKLGGLETFPPRYNSSKIMSPPLTGTYSYRLALKVKMAYFGNLFHQIIQEN